MKIICLTVFNVVAILSFSYGVFVSRLSEWYWILYLFVSFLFYAMIKIMPAKE